MYLIRIVPYQSPYLLRNNTRDSGKFPFKTSQIASFMVLYTESLIVSVCFLPAQCEEAFVNKNVKKKKNNKERNILLGFIAAQEKSDFFAVVTDTNVSAKVLSGSVDFCSGYD